MDIEVKEVDFEKIWKEYFKYRGDVATVNVKHLAKHFFELGFKVQQSKSNVWHNVSEEIPTKFGSTILVACRNKNMEDGIWLYDMIQCWEGEWKPRVNWEDPVKWAYVKDLAQKGE